MKTKEVKKVLFSFVLCLLLPGLFVLASLSEYNTYIVYEGDGKTFHTSRSVDMYAVLSEMKIDIPADKYVLMPNEPENGVGRIYIYKKNAVDLKIANLSTVLYAVEGSTISDVLSENGIVLGDEDIISLPLETVVTDGMDVEITKVLHETREVSEEIAFETEKRPSSMMNKGTTKVIQEGNPGSKKVVYDIKTENGIEVSRTVMSETVIEEPQKKILEYGTKEVSKGGIVTTWSGEKLAYKRVLNMTATAYTTERTSDKITATGKVARVGYVAVDPKVIPLGSKLYILAANGKSWCYGIAYAQDTGVRGNKIDLFFDTYNECIKFGRKKATVYVLE